MSGIIPLGLMAIAVGLLSLFRTQQMNDVHVALIKLGPRPPKNMPGLSSTRLIGGFFFAIGALLIIADFMQ